MDNDRILNIIILFIKIGNNYSMYLMLCLVLELNIHCCGIIVMLNMYIFLFIVCGHGLLSNPEELLVRYVLEQEYCLGRFLPLLKSLI